MSKRKKIALAASGVCVVLILCLVTLFFTLHLAKRQSSEASKALKDAVVQEIDAFRETQWSQWDWWKLTSDMYLEAGYSRIDPVTKEAEVWFEILPLVFFKEYSTPTLFFNGERIALTWDEKKALLTARANYTYGTKIKECRAVIDIAGKASYQQSFLQSDREIGDYTGVAIEYALQQFPYPIFDSGSGSRYVKEGRAFVWDEDSWLGGDLPFGGEAVSARVYAVNARTGKELFSEEMDEDKRIVVKHTVPLKPGETLLNLYGEAIDKEGIRYLCNLGNVSWEYDEDDHLEPFLYSDDAISAIFPDGTTIELPTG